VTPTYFGMESFLGGRDFRAVPSIRSTSVERIDETTIALRYHGTRVVDYRSDGTFVLRSGGWHTSTTKARINDFSPARLYQLKFNWYLATPDGKRADFEDGMVIDGSGKPVTHDESAVSL
jgi:hypothetical protein